MAENNRPCLRSEFDRSPSDPTYPKFGFEVADLEHHNSRFKCIFCSRIIQDPIQSECGHRSCRGCFCARAAVAPNENVVCPLDDCDTITNRSQIMPDRAFSRELNTLKVACKYRDSQQCSWKDFLKDYQAHLDEAHARHVCSQCNESFASQALLHEHETKTCKMVFQSCPLAPYCSGETIRKTDLAQHFLSRAHQETVNKFLLGEYRFSEAAAFIDEDHDEDSNSMNKEWEEKYSQKFDELSKRLEVLTNDTAQLSTKYTHLRNYLQTSTVELSMCQRILNEKLQIKQSIHPGQIKLQSDIEHLEQLYTKNEHMSMDGTLTWRIDHVSEKIADAQAERQPSLLSPPFYSSPTGYKMRVRLFLFGDGSARRTHVSLFFALMKGEYDAILKWPFSHKVIFCLLDQSGNGRHMIDSFYPDVKSTSFQRPKEEVNIASGIPKFFPLPMLLQDDNGYVREDTIYIKIIIELNDIPKTLLPFMLSLNSALPAYAQENLINQETAKQKQETSTTSNSQTTPINT